MFNLCIFLRLIRQYFYLGVLNIDTTFLVENFNSQHFNIISHFKKKQNLKKDRFTIEQNVDCKC